MKLREYIHIPYINSKTSPLLIAAMMGFTDAISIKMEPEFVHELPKSVVRQALMDIFDSIDIQRIGFYWFHYVNYMLLLFVSDDETAMKVRLRFEVLGESFIADENRLALVEQDREFLMTNFITYSESIEYV